MKKTMLFLDGDKRATLSIIRSIGKMNTYHILSAGKSKTDLCRFSKYCEKHYKYDDPEKSIISFIHSLKEIIKISKPDYIFPCSDISLFSIYTSSFYDEIKEKLIAPNKETYLLSFDKDKMQKITASCGVKIIEEASFNECEFPIVVKPRQSRTIIEDRMIYGFRKIVHNKKGLEKALFEVNQYDKKPLLQKMIKGKALVYLQPQKMANYLPHLLMNE
ncbi:hypothetical protein [Bacillus taeanensis]|uniref:Uncharacterized protein n=1 Tax=Bacillus taeanensis TaxID=273032 RepID=A0A366XWA9_9BACI|nr:hypothetical protein [Bacillus taeanensis]RBW70187.1 hypothetical protein DS031_08345 [Bacillus taeanensis]